MNTIPHVEAPEHFSDVNLYDRFLGEFAGASPLHLSSVDRCWKFLVLHAQRLGLNNKDMGTIHDIAEECMKGNRSDLVVKMNQIAYGS